VVVVVGGKGGGGEEVVSIRNYIKTTWVLCRLALHLVYLIFFQNYKFKYQLHGNFKIG
jgi:hypothetical protein